MQGQALLHTVPANAPLPADAQPAAVAPTSVFLPKEHGSWSLALEPLALGLLVAPSFAGVALAAAALAGFFARRPLKAAFGPVHSARRVTARETLVMLAVLGLAGGLEVVVLGGWTALWPLLFAAPLGLMFARFDAQGEARAVAAEIAGSAAFAVLPVALATLAGWTFAPALALAAVALARSVPTVLTVRTALRVSKGTTVGTWLPVSAATLGVATLATLATRGLVPPFAVLPAGLLLGRTLWFASVFRPAWPARRIGIFEAALGGLHLGLTVLAYRVQ
ncbi:MAG: YwiC-like family protein [Opitutae bacterium]|nr:YwiC-like family protein [Opitutae bacterium]